MSKLLHIAVTVVFLNLIVFAYLTPYVLADTPPSCTSKGIGITPNKNMYDPGEKIMADVDFTHEAYTRLTPDWSYAVAFYKGGIIDFSPKTTEYFPGNIKQEALPAKLTLNNGLQMPDVNVYNYTLEFVSLSQPLGGPIAFVEPICTGPTIQVLPAGYLDTSCTLSLPQNIEWHISYPVTNIELAPKTTVVTSYDAWILPGTIPAETFNKLTTIKINPLSNDFVWLKWLAIKNKRVYNQTIDPKKPSLIIPDYLDINNYTLVIIATYKQQITVLGGLGTPFYGCNVSYFSVTNDKTSDPIPQGSKTTPQSPAIPACSNEENSVNPCSKGGGLKIPGCSDPIKDDPKHPGIATAIGCIHTNPAELAKDLMTFIIGIAGGIAFLLMVMGAFQMLTSAGNPDHLNAGRERLTNAVIGLLFVIFAVLFLQIIGVDILKIPGFVK